MGPHTDVCLDVMTLSIIVFVYQVFRYVHAQILALFDLYQMFCGGLVLYTDIL